MIATKNPLIITQIFATISFAFFPLLFMLIRQQFIDDYSFTLIYVAGCLIGLICSAMLLFKYNYPNYAFLGIGIHLFALSMLTCY